MGADWRRDHDLRRSLGREPDGLWRTPPCGRLLRPAQTVQGMGCRIRQEQGCHRPEVRHARQPHDRRTAGHHGQSAVDGAAQRCTQQERSHPCAVAGAGADECRRLYHHQAGRQPATAGLAVVRRRPAGFRKDARPQCRPAGARQRDQQGQSQSRDRSAPDRQADQRFHRKAEGLQVRGQASRKEHQGRQHHPRR